MNDKNGGRTVLPLALGHFGPPPPLSPSPPPTTYPPPHIFFCPILISNYYIFGWAESFFLFSLTPGEVGVLYLTVTALCAALHAGSPAY